MLSCRSLVSTAFATAVFPDPGWPCSQTCVGLRPLRAGSRQAWTSLICESRATRSRGTKSSRSGASSRMMRGRLSGGTIWQFAEASYTCRLRLANHADDRVGTDRCQKASAPGTRRRVFNVGRQCLKFHPSWVWTSCNTCVPGARSRGSSGRPPSTVRYGRLQRRRRSKSFGRTSHRFGFGRRVPASASEKSTLASSGRRRLWPEGPASTCRTASSLPGGRVDESLVVRHEVYQRFPNCIQVRENLVLVLPGKTIHEHIIKRGGEPLQLPFLRTVIGIQNGRTSASRDQHIVLLWLALGTLVEEARRPVV